MTGTDTDTHGMPFGELAHPALFYRSDDEYVTALAGFASEGLATDEPVLMAVPGRKVDLLRSELFDMEATGQLRLADMSSDGRNPTRIIGSVLHAFVAEHAPRQVRIVGEPIWQGRSEDEYAAAVQHEALINVAFARTATTILCPYDVNALSPRALTDAARTHPTIADNGALRPCAEYADPAAVATAQPPSPPPDDATELALGSGRLAALRQAVRQSAARHALAPDRIDDFQVAVNEVATNALTHGSAPVTVRLWRADGHLVCQVHDAGNLEDLLSGRLPPEPEALRGRGLRLVNDLADLVHVHASGTGTDIRMHIRLR